jgi:radical SAM superfamily enzyme YgiQ (UPF0313 family)
MNILLFYPPGEIFQRGEDRCQSNIKSSTATSMRACNDLGYMAAILREKNKILLKDYQTEKLTYNDFIDDINNFKPDYLILSTTNATIFEDINIINKVFNDTSFNGKVIIKGAIIFDAEFKLLDLLDLSKIDYLVGGEIDWIINDIVNEMKPRQDIPGIFYKENGKWFKNDFTCWNNDLDKIPFPARDLMPNYLYTRPDTNETMATIQTSRGCPSQCIYCLSPTISGKKIRYRSPENVFEELLECYEKYKIKNFFFKADTFTFNEEWVLKLCDLIKNSKLYGNIHYTANSRVKPLSKKVLEAMKDTGCFTIALGFESGSEKSMKLIKKGTTVEENYKAVKMIKEIGIPVFGFFMIGFPWENKEDIKETEKMIFDLDCDFIELHIALPYYGTKLYELCKEENVLNENVLGVDYFHSSTNGTKHISSKDLIKIRKKIILKYHMRPKYIFKKLKNSNFNIKIIMNYIKYGIKLILNMFK